MSNILVGAAAFFVSSQVLEKGLHVLLLKSNPVTAAWFHAHAIAFAIYACLSAGLFEEAGRFLAMRFLVRPSGNPGSAVAYGIGHGGLEGVLVGSVAMAQSVVFAIMLNAGRLEATLGPSLAPDALAQLRTGLQHLTPTVLAIAAAERLIVMLIQIGLSLVVWRAVEHGRLRFLALAIVLHAAIDFPAGLFQAGQISMLAAEGPLLAVGAALAAFFIHGLPRRSAASAPQRT